MGIGLQDATVDSLIKEDGTSWDADILDEFFNERDQHLIYKIPLPRVVKPDQLQWIWDKKGVYMVKSSYHFLLNNTVVPNYGFGVEFWKRTWSLQIPAKVKHFV